MAIRQINNTDGTGNEEKITLEIDNGDLQALQNIVSNWDFIDIPSSLRFSIAAMIKASTRKEVGIFDERGRIASISPSETLLKADNEEE